MLAVAGTDSETPMVFVSITSLSHFIADSLIFPLLDLTGLPILSALIQGGGGGSGKELKAGDV